MKDDLFKMILVFCIGVILLAIGCKGPSKTENVKIEVKSEVIV